MTDINIAQTCIIRPANSATMKTNWPYNDRKKKFSVFIFVIFVVLAISINKSEAQTNYYFSMTMGNDSLSSTQAQNPSTPWKTISKLNSFFDSLLPGDSVLFKRDDVFDGSILVTRSGNSTSSIILGAYGTGNKPVINGFTTLTNWTSLGSGVYSSPCPSCSPGVNMVTVNGVNTPIGRWPDTGYLSYESYSGTTSITDDQLNDTPNWTGAEVVIRKLHWIIDRNIITSHTTHTLNYTASSAYTGRENYGYFIQNDPKTLDSIGEWYFEPINKNMQMYFGTNTPDSSLVKASTTNVLVSLVGKSYITFDNLAL
jgi:hypothetical protein